MDDVSSNQVSEGVKPYLEMPGAFDEVPEGEQRVGIVQEGEIAMGFANGALVGADNTIKPVQVNSAAELGIAAVPYEPDADSKANLKALEEFKNRREPELTKDNPSPGLTEQDKQNLRFEIGAVNTEAGLKKLDKSPSPWPSEPSRDKTGFFFSQEDLNRLRAEQKGQTSPAHFGRKAEAGKRLFPASEEPIKQADQWRERYNPATIKPRPGYAFYLGQLTCTEPIHAVVHSLYELYVPTMENVKAHGMEMELLKSFGLDALLGPYPDLSQLREMGRILFANPGMELPDAIVRYPHAFYATSAPSSHTEEYDRGKHEFDLRDNYGIYVLEPQVDEGELERFIHVLYEPSVNDLGLGGYYLKDNVELHGPYYTAGALETYEQSQVPLKVVLPSPYIHPPVSALIPGGGALLLDGSAYAEEIDVELEAPEPTTENHAEDAIRYAMAAVDTEANKRKVSIETGQNEHTVLLVMPGAPIVLGETKVEEEPVPDPDPFGQAHSDDNGHQGFIVDDDSVAFYLGKHEPLDWEGDDGKRWEYTVFVLNIAAVEEAVADGSESHLIGLELAAMIGPSNSLLGLESMASEDWGPEAVKAIGAVMDGDEHPVEPLPARYAPEGSQWAPRRVPIGADDLAEILTGRMAFFQPMPEDGKAWRIGEYLRLEMFAHAGDYAPGILPDSARGVWLGMYADVRVTTVRAVGAAFDIMMRRPLLTRGPEDYNIIGIHFVEAGFDEDNFGSYAK